MQTTHTAQRIGWLIPVLLLGFVIFMHGLLDESLWADEGWTIAATAGPNPVTVITEWVAVDVHPPLFFIGLGAWRSFTGDTLLELRYYSVLLSMLGIALIYRLGKGLFGERAGVLSALFYALHDLIRALTQEVRHYPQQMAFSALAMWLYWRFWQQPTRARGVVFALGGTALLYTHYWGAFLLLGLALHALITRRGALRPFVVAFGGIALLYAPWLPVIYHQVTLERPGGLPHALENTREVYSVLIYQLVGIPELFWVVLAVMGVFGVVGGRLRLRWRPPAASIAALLVIVCVVAGSLLLNTVYPTLSFRAMAVIIPAVIVLAAHGLADFRPREQFAMIAFIILYSLSTTSAGPAIRPPWPDVADDLVRGTVNADVILLELDTDVHSVAYYLDMSGADVAYAYSEETRQLRPAAYEEYMAEMLTGRDGLWVAKLGWPPIHGDPRPELLSRGFVETAPELDYGLHIDRPILLWRFDRPPQGEPRTVFGAEMVLHTATAQAHPEGVTVNLLWSGTPTREYTVSAFLLGEGGAFRNTDSYPLAGRSPTSTWVADRFYFDSSFIPTLDLPAGDYQVGVGVYTFADADFSEIENLSADDCSDDPDCRFVIIGAVTLGDG